MSTMTVTSSTSQNTFVTGTSGTPGPQGHHHHGGGALAVAAKTLGMDVADVRSALKNGKSLDDLAGEKGISHTDLVSALKAGMPQDLQNSDKADEVAEKMATTKGLDALRPPRPAGNPPSTTGQSGDNTSGTGVLGGSLTSAQASTLQKLADLLGTDSRTLLDTLKSGTSLADLVKNAGVDQTKLASVLQDGLMFDDKA
jgi:lambda repressor-like predicted transcriptional regulator